MSAGFLPNVSSCAWVWHVRICFWKRLWTKFIKTNAGKGKVQPHGRPCPTWDCWSHFVESQPSEVERGCCLGPAGDRADTLLSCSSAGGVFCKVAALSLQAFSEEAVRLPFCNWLVCGCSLAAQRRPLHHLCSVQTGLGPQTVYTRGCLLLSDTRGGQTAGA